MEGSMVMNNLLKIIILKLYGVSQGNVVIKLS